jgi:hypothetical protein
MARPNQPEAERQAQKDKFVEYFKDVPVQKYAAMYVGITEQTATVWLREDPEFLKRVQEARADWVKKRAIETKAEFALERLEHEVFKERKEETINVGVNLSAEQAEQLIRARAKRSDT